MRNERASWTAQNVALARAQLTSLGVLQDDLAATMLRPAWAAAHRVLQIHGLAALSHNWVFAQLAARTRFVDEHLGDALRAGIAQVVVIGAGYDTRAWRWHEPGVSWFEVDHPATQADKRRRSPVGGPTFVAVDLAADQLDHALEGGGLSISERAVFILEGVSMYLSEAALTDVLLALARCGTAGSRLIVNFGANQVGSKRWKARATVLARAAGAGGEPMRFGLRPAEVGPFLSDAGWTPAVVWTGRDVSQFLTDTVLPATVNPDSSFATADRR